MRRPLPLRLVVTPMVVVGGGLFAMLATGGMVNGGVYYYTPSEIARHSAGGDVVRVGGTVVPGSVRWERRGVLRFELSDGEAALAVANRGAPPDLFTAGKDALVEGRVEGGVLRASDVIVKHDENYRAPGPKGDEARR